MPEYLAPGVYVQEVSFRAKSIEGVSTSTAGFVGSTAVGPAEEPVLVQSVSELEATFGTDGDLTRAARAFFAEDGRRLFVQRVDSTADLTEGLRKLESVAEIAVVAAPGADAAAALVDHATRCNRFALIDSGKGQSIDEVFALRRGIDSSHTALYYPWLRAADGVDAPPSGFLAGVYARNDVQRGVWKAPANITVASAGNLERPITQAESELLGSNEINPFRVFTEGQVVVWGARTTSSDPEWKYVSVRRYFTYLEHSIDRSTQWTVLEPNAEPLWAAMRETLSSFLDEQFRDGALAGRTADEAYFVKCDQSTMTQDDLDQGLLTCIVGVAPLRPAEFIEIHIARWTADHSP